MRTLHIAIALLIHSFDRTVHIAIAVIIHSFDRRGFLSPSLISRLIAPYKKSTPKAGAQCAPYSYSFDRSLQEINPKAWYSVDFYRTLQEINPKGWCAVRTLHIAIALLIQSL